MVQISQQCPHCLTEQAALTACATSHRLPGMGITLVFFQCGICGQGLIHEYSATPQSVSHWINGTQLTPGGGLLVQYPLPSVDDAPPDTPNGPKSAFLDGLHNLQRKKYNPAVAMFRRALELAVRLLDEDAPKSTPLIKRIERLPADYVTPAMKNWAHVVRIGGNDALHDPEEFSETDAEDLRVFTELFLTYAFTLPAMLEKRKGTQDEA